MNPYAEDILMHYGMPRRSGRYPYGSGEDPYQHSGDFASRVSQLRKDGIPDTDIAKMMGLESTTQLRIEYRLAKNERRALDVATAKGLREKGYSLNEIAAKMGYENDSSVRSLLNSTSETNMLRGQKTADYLKAQIDGGKRMIDIGPGVEQELGISRNTMDEAVYLLQKQGYNVHGGRVPQATNPGKMTTITALCAPDVEAREFYDFKNKGLPNIESVVDYKSYDGGETFQKSFVYPAAMDSKRVKIRYADEDDGSGATGKERDGLIEIRRGVDDLSLGEAHYAQVRINVDDTHYMKGMAIYSDNIPDGYDVVFNTKKAAGTPMGDVLKELKKDPSTGQIDRDNPFGALIKEQGGQSYYIDKDGNRKLSLINKRADEGDWSDWKDALPSQFLSKQNISLVKRQLKIAEDDKLAELSDIREMTNPTVRKNQLMSFAEDCDSAAVHLQAASLPRQKYKVLIPVPSLKDDECYAPTFNDGETLALIRYPHGGTFEIPIVKVNNKQKDAKALLGNDSQDAIGINSRVASRLSGADFDGDCVMAIPCNSATSKIKITATRALKGLEGFDTDEYAYSKSEIESGKAKIMHNTQNEMGRISNLITDMTIKGATEDELARAVKHSMVVIDAEKHKLNYHQSEIDNGIKQLKDKYQGTYDEETGKTKHGASTLISRAKSEVQVPKRKGQMHVADDGTTYYDETPEYYTDKNGKVKQRMQSSTRMAEAKDARTLISEADTPVERLYADYANKMKSLANTARKEAVSTKENAYSPSANKTYAKEVQSLESKLKLSELNAPRERQAQLMAAAKTAAKKRDNPDMTKKEEGKVSQRALTEAREIVGAKRKSITVTDKEWEAIQAGAVSKSKLQRILKYTDESEIKKKASPYKNGEISTSKQNRIKRLQAQGYTIAEIASDLDISTSTVSKYL